LSTSNTIPKDIKNNYSVDGNVTLGISNYRRAVRFFYRYSIEYNVLFPPVGYTMFHILPLKQTEEI
jgi:hypothetical protein